MSSKTSLDSSPEIIFRSKKALLLDMNNTFMFGEDRFGGDEDFSIYYQSIGGKLFNQTIYEIIQHVFQYLDDRYTKEEYRNHFPSVAHAVAACIDCILVGGARDDQAVASYTNLLELCEIVQNS